MNDLDSAINSLEAWEEKERGGPKQGAQSQKVLIGVVDQFFDRINVAALELKGTLKVGDIIEIGTDEEAIRQRVSSMQINRENIEVASQGDSVGIKLNHAVTVGSSVYRMDLGPGQS